MGVIEQKNSDGQPYVAKNTSGPTGNWKPTLNVPLTLGMLEGRQQLNKADEAVESLLAAAESMRGAGAGAVGAADSARAQAESAATDMRGTAAGMRDIADPLVPAADRLASDAEALRSMGMDNTALAMPWLRQSEGLLGLDESAGGISGEFASLYRKLDPDLQMALAASDARNESAAQTESAVRALQRAGVSPTADAIASLRSRASDQSAALVASIKTSARQNGVQMQMGALETALKMAVQQSGVGQGFLQDATNNIAQAIQAENASGEMRRGAANIYGASGDLVANAQKIIEGAASGQISASATQLQGFQAIVNAFSTAAEFYSAQAGSHIALGLEGIALPGQETVDQINSLAASLA